MSNNDQKFWPKRFLEDRGAEPLREIGMAYSMLNRLEQLERETRPSGGDLTSKDKDLKSREAIFCAGYLIRLLAGWAIDHQQGLAMGGLISAEAPIPEMENDPSFAVEKAKLDSHENERIGNEAQNQPRDFTPVQQRRFAAQVAALLKSSVFPADLAEGLRALEFGEVRSILQKENVEGEKRNYTERVMQLRALEYIEYEKARGRSKESAREVVKGRFGVTADAIRKWERPLRESLGSTIVSRALITARQDGELVRRVKMGPNAATFNDLTEQRYLYQMELAGRVYKESLKAKQNSN